MITFVRGMEKKSRNMVLGGGGFLLVLAGLYLGWSGFPLILSARVKQNLELSDNSEAFERWKKLPVPLEFKVYLFNVTNPEQVNRGEKPIVREMGPYIYDEFRDKVDIQAHDDGTLSYMLRSTFFFNEEKSGCRTENDVVTILNAPLMGTASMVQEMFPVGLRFLDSAVPYLFPGIANIFLTGTVGEFLFKGSTINCSSSAGPAGPVCEGLKAKAPPTLVQKPDSPDYLYSFFAHKNKTPEGPYRVHRGLNNIEHLGLIVSYENKTQLNVWLENSTCNTIRGTDSTIFPPYREKLVPIYIFTPDLCGTQSARFEKTINYQGIKLYRYIAAEENFGDPKVFPDNMCRCRLNEEDPNEQPKCLKGGVIDGTLCQGVPVIFSQPHFYGADEEYTNFAEGLKSVKEKHETFLLLEPLSGAPIEGRKRMQMSMFLKRIDGISVLANVSEGLFPLLWVEEGCAIDKENNKKVHLLFSAIFGFSLTKWILISLGMFCVMMATLMQMKLQKIACFSSQNQVMDLFHSRFKVSQDSPSRGKISRESQKGNDFIMSNIPIPGVNEHETQTFSSTLYPRKDSSGALQRGSNTLPR